MILGLRTAIYPGHRSSRRQGASTAPCSVSRRTSTSPITWVTAVGGFELGLIPDETSTRRWRAKRLWGVADADAAYAQPAGDRSDGR